MNKIPNPDRQVFLFPFAGGSSYAYNPIVRELSPDFNAVALEMSGHGIRITEPLLSSMPEIVTDLVKQVVSKMKPPYFFFGHSLGAVTSYLCTLELKKRGYPLPRHLFFSGREGILTHPDRRIRHLPSAEFWEVLTKLGGVSAELIEHEELKVFFEPILRADLEAIEEFSFHPGPKLAVPATLLQGEDDLKPPRSRIAWEEVVEGAVTEHILPGNHFFFLDHPVEVATIIRQSLVPAAE